MATDDRWVYEKIIAKSNEREKQKEWWEKKAKPFYTMC